MDKNLIIFLNFLFFYIYFVGADNTYNDLLPNQLNDNMNKNLQLKISLDLIRLKISDSLYLECPLEKLNPTTFMFLTKDAVDFVSRFSIQLNDTFKKNLKQTNYLTDFLDNQQKLNNLNDDNKKNKIKLICKWLSIDLDKEFGNLTLFLNKPKDNTELNNHLYKYFDLKQDHSLDKPKIIKTIIKPLRKKIGDKVTFYCNVQYNNKIKINWFKKLDNGNLINLNDELKTNNNGLDIVNFRLTSNRLTIKEISKDDYGEYWCRVTNDYGEDYAFFNLESIVNQQNLEPTIDSFDNVNLKENRSVQLNCSITSYDKFFVQWFELVDCKQLDCNSNKYQYFFILNKEYYKPIDSSKFDLISINRIQYLTTYTVDKSQLIDKNRYICMIRSNQNGLNYKIMTLTLNKENNLINNEISSNNLIIIIIILSIFSFILFIILIIIFIKLRTLNRRRSIDPIPANNLINNNVNNSRKKRSLTDNSINSLRNKSSNYYVKDSNIVELINDGRIAQPITNIYHNSNNYSSDHLNINFNHKDNRSKSDYYSIKRNNNTPVLND